MRPRWQPAPSRTMPTRTADRRPRLTRVDGPEELRRRCDRIRAAGLSLGLVPTMGALHAGHRQLIQRSRVECDRTAVSIFVNPTQFGPAEDFDRYPRPLDTDLAVCAELGVDLAYVPSDAVMYPEGFSTRVNPRGALAAPGISMAWRRWSPSSWSPPGRIVPTSGTRTPSSAPLSAALPPTWTPGPRSSSAPPSVTPTAWPPP